MGCVENKKHKKYEICLIFFATIILTYVVMALSLTAIFETELNFLYSSIFLYPFSLCKLAYEHISTRPPASDIVLFHLSGNGP